MKKPDQDDPVYIGGNGYHYITFQFRGIEQHERLDKYLWMMETAREPRGGPLIHRDGNPLNNAFENLKESLH
jgi:hypothetical protein